MRNKNVHKMTTYQVAIADAMYAMTAKCKSKKLWFNLLKQNINQNGRQTHWHKHRGVCTAKYLRSIQNQNGYLQKTRALDFNLQQDFCCRKNAFRITLSAENFQQQFGAREVCRASQERTWTVNAECSLKYQQAECWSTKNQLLSLLMSTFAALSLKRRTKT